MSKTTPAAVPVSSPKNDELFLLVDTLGKFSFNTSPKIALLIKWCEAESTADDWGGSEQMDKLAWRGAEDLLRDVLRDIETLMKATGAQDAGFATLADDEDGAK